ncbi:uncharacterized protein TNCV_3022351 [Trichonephila clavipes]|nr:uncharacterized protein TNCV_3022351 [Trichonephila clavipes]
MVLKANDRRTSCPCHDEFRGPRSDYVRQQLNKIEAGTQQLAIWPGSEETQEESIQTCPEFVVANGAALPREMKLIPLGRNKCDVNGHVHPNDTQCSRKIDCHDVQELWFQQDGATCHTARATIDLLKDTFGDRLISHFGPVNWPPRSCDLIPLDYFLWGYVKSLVYADKPQKLDHLEDNIHRVIADIRPQMLEKVIKNWTSRLDYIRASRGSPMPEIIFEM